MSFITQGTTRYFAFDLLQSAGVRHGVFTRHGGVSDGNWRSLNLGSTVGDKHESVQENISRLVSVFDRDVDSIYDVWQVHGTDVVIADLPRNRAVPHIQADSIITDKEEITLLMRFADCVPIMLFDPLNGAAGIVHAGWQGTVKKAVKVAVKRMEVVFQSRPSDILAGIGPSICPDHYEVGENVVKLVEDAFGESAGEILSQRSDGKAHLDLWKANELLLDETGVKSVETAGICTACHTEDWFSHRAERGKTGRFGALIIAANGRG